MRGILRYRLMQSSAGTSTKKLRIQRLLLGTGTWALGWVGMHAMDGRFAVANLAMMLVLVSAMATLWLSTRTSMLLSMASVLAFNWTFVPPRQTFHVDVLQDGILLGSMLLVSWLMAILMARQRSATQEAQRHARQAEQLRGLNETLRDGAEPAADMRQVSQALHDLVDAEVVLLVLRGEVPASNDPAQAEWLGMPTADESAGLWHCTRERSAFGPGTGRYESLTSWYLPLRGGTAAYGAAVVRAPGALLADRTALRQAQALCDQYGLALERRAATQAAEQARQLAQIQAVRNAMLAAISHDYRTPLATILGAASSLVEQDAKLDATRRERLARTIAEEAEQLARLTDNTLQLARLTTSGVELQMDWESPEELVGALMHRTRRRIRGQRIRARVETGLPLIRCDALLLSQLLDNLVDNALKYSDGAQEVEMVVRRQGGHIVFAVKDRGAGVPIEWRERIFEAFQRGQAVAHGTGGDAPARRGAGVGLTVCRAIAQAHGGELRYRSRPHGGSSFECWLPEAETPRINPAGVEANP